VVLPAPRRRPLEVDDDDDDDEAGRFRFGQPRSRCISMLAGGTKWPQSSHGTSSITSSSPSASSPLLLVPPPPPLSTMALLFRLIVVVETRSVEYQFAPRLSGGGLNRGMVPPKDATPTHANGDGIDDRPMR
jgi:hypothetical protein